MVESPDFNDPVHGIPVFSLYGEVRRPTAAMMDTFDVLLVDLQDVGCRIYTFITTLRYVLEEAAAARQERCGFSIGRIPPAARSKACGCARAGRASSAPARCRCVTASRWASSRTGSCARCGSTSTTSVIEMEGWQPAAAPGFGWPLGERTWVNPSPNAAESVDGARVRRHRDARRHDAVRRPRHDASARAVRRAGHRCARAARDDAQARAAVAARLPAARLLVRADVSQARRQALRRPPDPRRRPGLRSRRVPAVAPAVRSRSRRCGSCSRTIRSGATSRTSTRRDRSPSTSSTAASCCANGSTTPTRQSADLEAAASKDERDWEQERALHCCTEWNSEYLAKSPRRKERRRKKRVSEQ